MLGDLTSLAPLGEYGFGITSFKQNVAKAADARSNTGYTALRTDADCAAYGAALGPCITAAPDVATFVPDGQGELAAELEKLLGDQEKSPSAAVKLTAYGDCMTETGYPVRNFLELYQLVESRFPDPGAGWKVMESDARWTAAVAFERTAADVDSGCRSDLHTHVMSAVQPELARFVERHAAAIAEVRRQWSEYRATATK
ncbi:hypothetical protein Cme02nite_05200 [Catellatospora methionotrophica]|uniref:Uncharacterized protein n=1 Tax=Catellatospora methionotrophica TaxID=121620 RepID=A0A8J3L0K7_9ACTN|nr:hypothetical protein [Catellatospora methionotrophica]GIG12188.1 hypothetical protein Cme02nite_05200 [Catellatospora methionotrophica]